MRTRASDAVASGFSDYSDGAFSPDFGRNSDANFDLNSDLDSDRPLKRRLTLKSEITARFVFALLIALLLFSITAPSSADLDDEIDELEAEQEELQRQQEQMARDVDAKTAELNELATALGVLNTSVNEKAATLADAETSLVQAEDALAVVQASIRAQEAAVERLEEEVADRAIASYTGASSPNPPILRDEDITKLARMDSLVDAVNDSDLTVVDELTSAKDQLLYDQQIAVELKDEAAELRSLIAAELADLEETRDAHAALTAEAELRLESALSEQQFLAERGDEIASELDAKNKALAEQLALAQRNSTSSGSTSGGKYPTADELVVVQGFKVHIDIADELEAMLNAAAADGIYYGGWGYRDHQTQIRLRKEHCGTSEYAIWSMPSWQCRPPTARPGASQHELGKAIDFTYGGSTIGSHSSEGFKWLAANAAEYGFYNLPSEPWHWSVNGR